MPVNDSDIFLGFGFDEAAFKKQMDDILKVAESQGGKIAQSVEKTAKDISNARIKQGQDANRQIIKDEQATRDKTFALLKQDILRRSSEEQKANKSRISEEQKTQQQVSSWREKFGVEEARRQDRIDADLSNKRRKRAIEDAKATWSAQQSILSQVFSGGSKGLFGGSTIGNIALGVAGGAGIVGSIGAIGTGLKEVVKIGFEAEERFQKLSIGLRNAGVAEGQLDSKTKALQASTYNLANSYAVNNHQLQEATARYLEMGGNIDKLEQKQKLIIAISERAGIDLDTAARYLFKGTDPELLLKLTRIGIAFDENATAEDRFNQLAAQSDKLLSGLAAKSETAAGKANRLKNEWDEYWSSVGKGIITAGGGLINFFSELDTSIEKSQVAVGRFLHILDKEGTKKIEDFDEAFRIGNITIRGHAAALDVDTDATMRNIRAKFGGGLLGGTFEGKEQTPEQIRLDQQKQLDLLTVDLDNKKALYHKAMDEKNTAEIAQASKELKIAGDKLNAFQKIGDDAEKLAGRSDDKTGKDKNKKAFDALKEQAQHIEQLDIASAQKRILNKQEYERRVLEIELRTNQTLLSYAQGMGQNVAEEEKKVNDSREKLREFDRKSLIKHYEEINKKIHEQGSLEITEELKTWDERFKQDSDLRDLQIKGMDEGIDKQIAALDAAYDKERIAHSQENDYLIQLEKNYWKDRTKIYQDSLDGQYDEEKKAAETAARGIANAFDQALFSPLETEANKTKNSVVKALLSIPVDILKGFEQAGIKKLIESLFTSDEGVSLGKGKGLLTQLANYPAHASGYLVPGYGGGDTHPALLEGGETVVPKHLTPLVAGLMKSHGVPGFQVGGVAGGNYLGITYPTLSSSELKTLVESEKESAKELKVSNERQKNPPAPNAFMNRVGVKALDTFAETAGSLWDMLKPKSPGETIAGIGKAAADPLHALHSETGEKFTKAIDDFTLNSKKLGFLYDTGFETVNKIANATGTGLGIAGQFAAGGAITHAADAGTVGHIAHNIHAVKDVAVAGVGMFEETKSAEAKEAPANISKTADTSEETAKNTKTIAQGIQLIATTTKNQSAGKAANAASGIANLLGGSSKTNAAGEKEFGTGDFLKGFLGVGLSFLGLADGGRSPIGVPYKVGERGTEYRVDYLPGMIYPNHSMRSASVGSSNTDAILKDIHQAIQEQRLVMPSSAISDSYKSYQGTQIGKKVGNN